MLVVSSLTSPFAVRATPSAPYLHSCFIPRGALRQSNKGYGVQNYKYGKMLKFSGRFFSAPTKSLYIILRLLVNAKLCLNEYMNDENKLKVFSVLWLYAA